MNLLRFVGDEACTNSRYLNLLKRQDSESAVMDIVSDRPNATLRATISDTPLSLECEAELRDFRDIAVLSYLLDTLSSRSLADDYWSRDLNCVVPVRNRKLWKSLDPLLLQVLLTLSGDNYAFEWMSCKELPVEPRHKAVVPTGMDCVCLFSGGIDSLLGAYSLLKAGKRVLLVGHQSEGATASAQSDLYNQLIALFPGQAMFIQFRVSLSMGTSPRFPIPQHPEDTHRVRSFLFLGLAAAIAAMAGVKEIYMPENGLIAINPPLGLSRIGTCSTRTAHPKFLLQWKELADKAGVFQGQLINPFICHSKTDMIQSADSRVLPLVFRSVSCSRPSRYNFKHVRHCGYCVPCVYRRAALSSIKKDDPSEYAFDPFKNLDSFTETTRRDFIALARFSAKFTGLNYIQKQQAVVSQGYFPPSVSSTLGSSHADDYSPWVKMLERWSAQFLELLNGKATSSTKKILGL